MSSDLKPIIIAGAGHSGTTILYRMLSMHPDAAWISQYSARALMARGPRTALLTGLDRMLRRAVTHSWQKHRYPWSRRIAPVPIEAPQVWDDVFAGEDEQRIADRIESVVTRHCRTLGTQVFIAKPPGRYRSRCAPAVSSVFPAAVYLHAVRDGRAVALSKLQEWEQRGYGPAEDPVERAVTLWIRPLQQVDAYASLLPVRHIRYEDFCEDVHGTLRIALAFAGLAVDRFPFDRCPSRLASTNPIRFARASADLLQTLDRRLAAYLRSYGYEAMTPSGAQTH